MLQNNYHGSAKNDGANLTVDFAEVKILFKIYLVYFPHIRRLIARLGKYQDFYLLEYNNV
jgi:hypothetical protein